MKQYFFPINPAYCLFLFFGLNFFSFLISADPLQEYPIVIIIPSYNNEQWALVNIVSAAQQKYKNFRIIYINDNSSDRTYEIIKKYCEENYLEHLITIIHNEYRKGALENLYNAIHSCKDYEIVVTLDGDDWFFHENVLSRINQEYRDRDAWLTYGQFVFYPSNQPGFCAPIPEKVIQQQRYRSHQWLTSHVRTFYAGLFKKIKKEDLLIENRFYPVTWDQAMILPMLEMAGSHIRFIPDVLYVYNYNNPLNDEKTSLPLVVYCETNSHQTTLF